MYPDDDHPDDDLNGYDDDAFLFNDLPPDELPSLDRTESFDPDDPLLKAIEDLRSHEFRLRRAAEDTLAALGVGVVAPLLTLLADEKPAMRDRISMVLVRIGHDAVPGLLTLLAADDRDLREIAAWTLGEIGDLRARSALRDAARDEDEGVAASAATALRRLDSASH